MTRRIGKFLFHSTFSALALALGLLLSACSGGTNYVGTGTTQAPEATESYTVTFETNGGSEVAAQTVEGGKTATEPAAPSKNDLNFGGWYTDSALTSAFSFSTAITSNITLYARWISASVPTFEVTFETNGGSAVAAQSITEGGTATEPTAPTKTGRTLQGWFLENTLTATKFDFTTAITADTTLYARWWYSEVFIEGRNITIGNIVAEDHEVTQGEYETYCTYGSNSPDAAFGVGANYPAYYVSWYDALVYCNKRSMAEGLAPCYTIGGSTDPTSWGAVPTSNNATWDAATCDFTAPGYRLPTEAEWEWLARGGDKTKYAWSCEYSGSDTIDDVAWYTTNSSKAHEVKQKTANSKGLYDMSGNVWEWCWDRYGTITATTPAAGADSGSDRVLRGGSWLNVASICAVSYRGDDYPYLRNERCGFRVVRSSS
jgi:uncharacterized repeat protein (TIGR02543 family)